MDNNTTSTPSMIQPVSTSASGNDSGKLPLVAMIVAAISLIVGIAGLVFGLAASSQVDSLRHENDLIKTYLEVDTEELEDYANGDYIEADLDDLEDEDAVVLEDTEE